MKNIFKYIAAALFVSTLGGCIRDKFPDGDGRILIQLVMPGELEEVRSTRGAIVERIGIRQYDIKNMYVLVFRDKGGDGSNDEFMYYESLSSADEIPNPNNPIVRTFNLPLRKSRNSEKQRLVFIGNYAASTEEDVAESVNIQPIETLLADPVITALKKPELLSKLRFFREGPSYLIWINDGIPMWGESPNSVLVIPSTQGSAFGDVTMLFAAARVDVATRADADFTQSGRIENLNIRNVILKGTKQYGYIAPRPEANYHYDTSDDAWKVENASVLSTAEGGEYNRGITTGIIANNYDISVAGNYIMAETPNGAELSSEARPHIIIQGYYTAPGEPENTTVPSFYRIDFHERNGAGYDNITYMDILRGHRYLVSINGVDGPGYATEAEASASVSTRINAVVTQWGQYSMNANLPQGDHTLEVDRANDDNDTGEDEVFASDFVFDGEEHYIGDMDNKITIFTDWHEGWTSRIVEVANDGTETPNPNWLWLSNPGGVDLSDGDPNQTQLVSINTFKYDLAVPRRGRIYITAGNWTYTINVEQKLIP